MATAYAAFTSLMHLLADLHEHPNPPIKLDEEQVDSLSSKISFFQRFLEDHHSTIDHGLGIRIADAAHAAEDVIDYQIADRVLDQNDFNESLQRVIESLDLVKKEAIKRMRNEKSQGNNPPKRHPTHAASSSQSPSATSGENTLVGIEGNVAMILEKLTYQRKSGRHIISITGMGGIGKTTLAREVYNHPYVKDYFDLCAWAAISTDYNIHESLIEILRCLNGTSKESLREKSEHELGDILHKSLCRKRYLIILDDVWDVEAWHRLRSFFPDSSGSGIVITTRESTIASIGSHRFRMDLLDEPKSWDLLCKKVFGKDSCPDELEDIGKHIANKCRGLPLAIVIIGGHLAKSPRTLDYWEYIADNLSSVVNSEENEHCLKILSLSYMHLPVYLKPCFLYLGIFPEDQKIRVYRIARLWEAEGFLKPINGKSLRHAARDYIHDLIDRNLILPSDSYITGQVVSFKIHDLMRDFCIKEALKQNFLCIVRGSGVLKVSNNERRMVVHQNSLKEINALQSPTLLRSLTCAGTLPSVVYKSLHVLSSVGWPLWTKQESLIIEEKTFLKVVPNLVNLRCLNFSINYSQKTFEIPPSIVLLWNLHTLAIEGADEVIAPPEIWEMPQLRDIDIEYLSLPDPPSEGNEILKNLQMARAIRNFSFSEDWVKRVPNVVQLQVDYEVAGFSEEAYSLNSVARLEKLEVFICLLYQGGAIKQNGMLSNLNFPRSLKVLTICCLNWDDVTTKIGSLPLLEVFYLWECSGSKWDHVEGQFVRLESLTLESCRNLQCFTADVNHFPCLKELMLYRMPCLEEISPDIGDVPTFRSIKLNWCADSAVLAAKEIADHQDQMGNGELQIKVVLRSSSNLPAESLSSSNFHVRAS